MSNQMLRCLAYENQVRIYIAETTDMVEQARKIHDTWPTATAALGRTLTAAALMAAIRDPEEVLTLQIMGGGPIGRIIAVATGTGDVKGYADEPHVDLELNARGKLDVGGAVGYDGNLYIIRDQGLKEPYRGIVRLISGEIGEDIANYFLSSEQTHSAVALGVKVNPRGEVIAAGGYILQLLPEAGEGLAEQLERTLSKLGDISSLISSEQPLEEILQRMVPDGHPTVPESIPLRLTCSCNREKFIGPLISLGAQELESLAAEDKDAELLCHFCRSTYYFSPEELRGLAKKAQGGGA